MKTKFIALALAAITLCMALTGCMHTDIGIKMNKDETGSISATFGIEKDFYEEIKDSGDDPFEGKTTVTYELGDETYIGYTETKEYGSYADMEKALLEMTYQTDMLDEMNDEEDAEPDDSEYTLYTPVEEKEPEQQYGDGQRQSLYRRRRHRLRRVLRYGRTAGAEQLRGCDRQLEELQIHGRHGLLRTVSRQLTHLERI